MKKKSKWLCNEDCNNCSAIENRQLALLMNIAFEKYGDDFLRLTDEICPNMNCCPICHMDGFYHTSECSIVKDIPSHKKGKRILNYAK